MKRLLPVFSYIFHPLFIPVYATLFYFLITQNFFYKHEIYLVFLQVLILTLLLPISLFYLLRSLGLIKSKRTLESKERRLPLAFYSLLLFVLINQSFSSIVVPELYYFFVGCLISTLMALLFLLCNFKASLHMIGTTALVAFVISISAYYHIRFLNLIAFLIVCAGFTASSRLFSKQHNSAEVLLGVLLGILPQVVLWAIWLLPKSTL